MNFNYEIINEEFENDKVWVVIFKSSILTTLKVMMEFDSNLNLKIFDLPNNRFEPIPNFQMKSLFSNIALNNCLLIPSLSHKLLSVSQLTKDFNCTVLMTSDGCIVQDAQTGTIIGRGTEKGGLYYVDEAVQKGHTSLAHGSPNPQLWMWHRCLGHPSLGYLKRLFPSLSNAIHP